MMSNHTHNQARKKFAGIVLYVFVVFLFFYSHDIFCHVSVFVVRAVSKSDKGDKSK